MKQTIWTLRCGHCEEDLGEGDLLQIKNRLKALGLDEDDIEEWLEDEKIAEVACTDCARSLS